jgi:predicted RNA-binding Zn-ribbon protein involved in translation (DUF1610 family)
MPQERSATKCPRCGEAAAGRFCAACGAALGEVACPTCGHAVAPGALFCPDCGSRVAGGASPLADHRSDHLPRLVGAAALIALVAFTAGVMTGRRSAGDPGAAEPSAGLTAGQEPAAGAAGSGAASATDISAMSPEERASRLFNRVMTYSEQGKLDSARVFAPMAIQAYESLTPVDAHTHYDIGILSVATGDVARARAEADTILAGRPNHLLGLVLAIRAADLAGDSVAEARFRRRLVAAAPTERTALKEYAEHARDIDETLKKAAGPTR